MSHVITNPEVIIIGTQPPTSPPSQKGFSTKAFPRPRPFSATQMAQISRNAPTNEVSTASSPGPVTIRYSRDLKGITGTVTQAGTAALGLPPTGLGDGVDSYLDAHGYDGGSRLHIIHAWRELDGLRSFVKYLTERGMAKSEVEWLWQLLVDNCY